MTIPLRDENGSFNRKPEACAWARDAHASGLRLNEQARQSSPGAV